MSHPVHLLISTSSASSDFTPQCLILSTLYVSPVLPPPFRPAPMSVGLLTHTTLCTQWGFLFLPTLSISMSLLQSNVGRSPALSAYPPTSIGKLILQLSQSLMMTAIHDGMSIVNTALFGVLLQVVCISNHFPKEIDCNALHPLCLLPWQSDATLTRMSLLPYWQLLWEWHFCLDIKLFQPPMMLQTIQAECI